ncbi:MAG: universal stress protein [Clostridiales bacterium]|nr:universal stress protein [Clostridiales bacterium]
MTMNTADRLLTVAIHTYGKAIELKTLLEHEGITVVLHNVNLTEPSVSSGVRVRIKESDLPLALRIIENSEIFIMPETTETNGDTHTTLLVPVDFSTYSIQACKLAFDIASRHNARITLLHSYVQSSPINMQLSASLDMLTPSDEDVVEEQVIDDQLMVAARGKMEKFSNRLRELIKEGSLAPAYFTTRIIPGVPEDVILDIAKKMKPMLIIMGTRGAEKKERELIGSVTAEVLDSCRQPVFTIPEQSNIASLEDIRNVVLVSNLEQNDMLALDTLSRLVPHNAMNIQILHIAGKRFRGTASPVEIDMMLEYCRTHYPIYSYSMESLDTDHAIEYLNSISAEKEISLIVIPNKKKNILARLFNPSLAHKLLFHADIPLMAVPV